ncbi:hypothetical protein [Amnibacterium kyonggiense]|uniref:Uncharacterized protein n=1 Tax=Amnibacterium kyonggiense TaxID=595671 RepID=A0A4R7FDF4_9MICO|nr:hypothetical protein [Amnibacterium kyonggiense]TDS74985.1 hypothetical protein CLV52_3509 [Amnibacterium kyonggiense]
MGETRPIRIVRAVGAAALVAAAAVVLTSCSTLGGGPAAAVSTASGPVLDPSIPSATPTEEVASDTPLPTPTATVEAPTSGPTSSAVPHTAVVPFVTSASWDAKAQALDVSAIVPGVVESNGHCTVTVTSGATTRTKEGDGVAASSYTGCEAVAFTGLAAGTWKVAVRYESAKSAGTSAVGTVQVG